jgi:hypothetical protein
MDIVDRELNLRVILASLLSQCLKECAGRAQIITAKPRIECGKAASQHFQMRQRLHNHKQKQTDTDEEGRADQPSPGKLFLDSLRG